MRLVAAAILAVALAAADASAAPIVYDGFDYTAGETLKDQDGGTGDWDGDWGRDDDLIVLSGGFAYTDSFGDELDTIGNRIGTSKDGSLKETERKLLNDLGAVTETIWASVMVQGSAGSSINNLVLSNDGLWIGQGGKDTTSSTWVLVDNDDVTADTGISANSLAFLLVRVDFTESGDETAWLWVDPDLDVEPATSSADATLTAKSFEIDKLRVRLTDDTAAIDEVRIGYDWRSVAPRKAPEPGTAGLLGLGLIGLALQARGAQQRRPRARAEAAARHRAAAARA